MTYFLPCGVFGVSSRTLIISGVLIEGLLSLAPRCLGGGGVKCLQSVLELVLKCEVCVLVAL